MKTTAFTKTYNKRVVLDLPELMLPEGKIPAVIGPNGSGKTTLMNMLSGIYFPDHGKIYVNGQEVVNPSHGIYIKNGKKVKL